ncbi:GLPGLI family protein [Hymenobacter sp. CRA2]|uniref:GLPGLI family protein n=1 Tax=Hymenobacter sp. CRA2 TaxID=1955620 RepID=UPI00098FF54A|nr:GLPGLI family protein [Hymenobacter sp. CRA2]OON70546.1 hypothetical protein B0919_00525 [Hymenobacter sp. CRA2]
MKNLPHLLLLAGLAGATYAQAQNQANIKCIYKIMFRPDSTNINNLRTEYGVLLLGNNISKYQTINKALLDSVVLNVPKDAMAFQMSFDASKLPKTYFSSIIFKDLRKKEVVVYDEVYIDQYRYQEPESSFAWQITPEKAVISGYKCQKATSAFGGRRWEAWFTNEVPSSDGPYKFHGLPGLIIKANDTKNYYTFTLSSLQKLASPAVLELPARKATTITKAEYTKAKRNYDLNAVDIMAQRGSVYGEPEEMKRRHQEKMKKRNNPIELMK